VSHPDELTDKPNIVVVGNGMVGHHFLDALYQKFFQAVRLKISRLHLLKNTNGKD